MAGTDAYVVLKNEGSDPRSQSDQMDSSVGTLKIGNVTANGAIFVAVGDGSSDSNVSITNSKFDMGSTSGVNTHNAAIDVETWNGSTMTVTSVSNNKIDFGANAGNSSSTGSRIAFASAYGMYFGNSGTQTITSANSNTVTFGADAGNSSSTGSGGAYTYVYGMYFLNYSTTLINGMKGNTVTGLTGTPSESYSDIYIFNGNGSNFTININGAGGTVVSPEAQESTLASENNDASVNINGNITMTK